MEDRVAVWEARWDKTDKSKYVVVVRVRAHERRSIGVHLERGGRVWERGRENVFQKLRKQLKFVSARIKSASVGHFEWLCD